jgi:two-component system, NtrC family, response regulator AtoC
MTPLAELIGRSAGIAAVRLTAERLLERRSDRGRLPPVLIQGETGVGKGLLARALHRGSPRGDGPFVDVNCAAIPDTLLEAELFGYERGAFTDARHGKPGLFQTASHGTLFLDEVGLLPEGLQAKLLKALEERAVRRLGSTRVEPVDAWIVTASNDDLQVAVRERRFREDLYHRLAVVTMRLPALRERGEDTLVLAAHFLARACAEYGLAPKTLSEDARAALLRYSWPGNVRELANVMERVALLSEAAEVTAELLDLPASPERVESRATPVAQAAEPAAAASLQDALGTVERAHVLEALRETGWNVTRAADRLGMSRDTLRYRMEKHGLSREGAGLTRRARDEARPPAIPAPPSAPRSAGASDPPVAVSVRWERRRLTFLRSALSLPEGSDPRLYPSRAVEIVVDKVRSFGGRVDELSPAGIVAVFGLEPVEDAPQRAALAAAAIQKAAERPRRGEGEALTVRSAIAIRQVLVGASRAGAQIDLEGKRQAWGDLETLIEEAEPDTVLVAEAAAPFLERHFDLAPVPLVDAVARRAFRLRVGETRGPGTRAGAPAFVGRTRELELLSSRLEYAIQGRGQVVGVLGEVGVGKSRLLHEFRQRLFAGAERRVTYLEGRCQSYASAIPYFPVVELLRQNFRLSEGDGPETITERVRAGLQDIGLDPDESAPYLLHLFGVPAGADRLAPLTPTAIKRRTFETLRQLILEGARRRPIVFVVEDLHWIDSTSEECFASIMESAAGAPALVVGTYRPGYRPPWMERSYATQVALPPLSREDSRLVVRSARKAEPSDQMMEAILDRAEGNPFFLEELSRGVEDAAGLPATPLVPDTVQEVLLVRIDRLPEASRRLLQIAAVVGPDIPLPLLRELWDGPSDLEPHLRELMRREFLYAKRGGAEPLYAFTHTLTRDVAYESVPPARRRTLHAKTGQALEAVYADRLGEVDDRLAYHYARTDQADKAILYLTRIADKAARTHAHTEAVRILEEALAHVDRLHPDVQDRRRLELAIGQAYSLIPLGGFQEIVNLLLRHQATLESLDDPGLGGHYHLLVGRSFLFLGDDRLASRHARLGIVEAMRAGDDATRGKIHYVLAQQGALSGRPREGLEHGRQAVDLLSGAGERWWIGPAHWATGLNHTLLGQFEAALEAERVAAASAEAVGDPQLESSAAWARGVALTLMGDWDAGIRACEQALASSPDPLNTALALGWLGSAHLEKGDVEQAIPRLEQSIRLLGQFRFPQPQAWFMSLLAEGHRLARRLETALDLASQALEMARVATSSPGVGWAERALGRIAQTRGALGDAADHFGEAMRAFMAAGAEYEVARIHLDLAELAAARGDLEAAARSLAEAGRRFGALGLRRHPERAESLAATLGVTLPTLAVH